MMNWLSTVTLMLGAFLTGAVLMGAVGVPLAGRRGYARGLEDKRVIDGVTELRDDTMNLPRQYGTLAEHHRRTRLPIGYGEVTDGMVLVPLGTTADVVETECWPLHWWVVWLVLLPVHYLVGWRHFWDTTPGQRLDRAAVRLGRYERRFFHTVPAPRHLAVQDLDGEAERRRLALFEDTQELKTLEVPVRELVGVA